MEHISPALGYGLLGVFPLTEMPPKFVRLFFLSDCATDMPRVVLATCANACDKFAFM